MAIKSLVGAQYSFTAPLSYDPVTGEVTVGGESVDSEVGLILLRRMVHLLESSGNVDIANRQRIALDSITAGTTLPAVTTVTTVSTVTNLATLAGYDQRQFHDVARIAYNTGPRAQLNFLSSATVLGA